MKTQLRVLLAAAVLALAAGWLGLRAGNTALEVRLAGGAAAGRTP
jgi:hypothetical protein